MKEFWDFDESDNYIQIVYNNNNYKVLKRHQDYKRTVQILNEIRTIILKICQYLEVNKYSYSEIEQQRINCFLLIHPYNYLLSEMQIDTQFDGLNKPKNLYKSNNKLGEDKYLRASYRDVFLRLRNNNGQFRSNQSIIDLVIHEITHTMCNHVTWRDDNHGKDFTDSENLLKNVVLKLNF